MYDISPLISEQTAVWPGDVSFSRQHQLKISAGANIDLSSMSSTVHLGSHADAPSHYDGDGVGIDQVPIENYWGPAWVVEKVSSGPLVLPEDCLDVLAKKPKRVLFKTNSFPNPDVFNEDFVAFHPEAITALGEAGVKLVGIDTPSFDPFHSKDLPSHQELRKQGILNLEGLVLAHVPAGEYELVALPLKLQGFDASPVRAALRPLKDYRD